MISAEIPVSRMISTADLSISLPDFIDYSIKNDLNIVTAKWLAHAKKISIAVAKEALMSYWNLVGKNQGYFATFSCLIGEFQSGNGLQLKLLDSTELNYSNVKSCEIYALHAAPLKDKVVQLGMINVPISCESDIKAPWITSPDSNLLKINEINTNNLFEKNVAKIDPQNQSDSDTPQIKKLKVEENDAEEGEATKNRESEPSVKLDTNKSVAGKKGLAPAASKQSSMMSFFKKK